MNYVIALIVTVMALAVAFHCGSVYGTHKTAHVWTDYIMDHCVRLDLLKTRITDTFSAAAKNAPEGAPVVIAYDTLIRIINETVETQNKGR